VNVYEIKAGIGAMVVKLCDPCLSASSVRKSTINAAIYIPHRDEHVSNALSLPIGWR